MTEPRYDEDSVTLGYLRKVLNNEITSEKSTSISKVYSTQPKPPYSKGDIWIDGNNVYVCINSRKVGYFSLSDWSTESGAKQEAEYKTRTYLTIPSNYRMGDLWILQSDNDHKSGKKGEILVANKNAESYNADDWVKEISYVTQEERQEINEELQTATNNIAKLETTAGLIEARVVQTEVKLDNTYSKEEVEALNEEITEELEIVKKDTGDLRVQSNSISAKVESVEANLTQVTNTAITQVKVLYALSNSATEAPTSGWSETAPEWQKGKYMWQKTATTNGVSTTYSEATCIQGAKGQDGENGKDGVNGKDGANGSDGKSAYQIWLDAGNTGTEEDYLVSLKGEQGIQGLQGLQGEKGEQGIPGPKGDTGATGAKGDKGDTGTSGATSYFHIKYSPVANPTALQMTETPNTYIGTYVDFTQEDSTSPDNYTWYKVIGDDGKDGVQGPQGEQGIPGTNGSNGQTSYFHIKYSNDGGKSFTDNNGETVGTYIGTYVDFTKADSTNVLDYTWAEIKGQKGDKGDTGSKGSDGVGINSTTVSYGISDNSTTKPTSWQTTIPTVAEGKYLWTRTITDYTDSSIQDTVTYTYAKQGTTGAKGEKGDTGATGATGAKGDKGDTGDSGSSVTVSSIKYQAGTSATTAPNEAWSDSVVSVAEGQYLWTKTTFSDGTVAYGVAKQGEAGAKGDKGDQGDKGDTGIGVQEIVAQYYLSDSNTAQAGGSWKETQDEWQNGKYMWTRSKITWTDNTITYTTPILATDVNETNEKIEKLGNPTASFQGKSGTIESAEANLDVLEIKGESTQETRSGINLLKNTQKASKTSNGVTFTYNDEDGTYIANGTNDGTGNSAVTITYNLFLEAGTYYTIPTGVNGYDIKAYDGTAYTSLASAGSFTLAEDTTFTNVYIQIAKGVTTPADNFVFYPITSKTPVTVDTYERYGATPSPEYPSEIISVESPVVIKSTGKNLFNIDTAVNGFIGDDEGIIAPQNASFNEKTSDFISLDGVQKLTCKLSVIPTTGGSLWWGYLFYDKNKEPVGSRISIHDAINVITINTIPDDAKYIRVSARFYDDGVLQIEKGTEATEYEPYKENITSIPLLHDLRSLPNGTHDRIYKKEGTWYDEQNIAQVVLDGGESWRIQNTVYYTTITDKRSLKENASTALLSNYFKPAENGDSILAIGEFKEGHFSSGNINILVNYDNAEGGVDNFKSWLSEHNTEVLYELAEPIITEISDEDTISALESIKTYKGITNITADAFIEANYYTNNNLNAEYVNKVENDINQRYTNEKIAQIELSNDEITSKVAEIQSSYNTLSEAVETVKSTMLTQTAELFEMLFEQTGIQDLVETIEQGLSGNTEQLETITEYIRFQGAQIELGKSTSQVKLVITNDRISFMTGAIVSAYISNNMLYITDSTILNKFQVGHWATEEDENENLNTRWIGGN